MVCVGEERTVGIMVVGAMVGGIMALDSDCSDTYGEAGITTVVDEETGCTAMVDVIVKLDATVVGITLAKADPVKVSILGVVEEDGTVLAVELGIIVVSAKLTAELAAAELTAVELPAVVILAIPAPTGDGTIPSLAAASSLASHWTVTPV